MRRRSTKPDFEALARRVYREFAGNPQKALTLAQKGLLQAQRGKDAEGIAKMRRAKAHSLREIGKLQEALSEYDRTVLQFQELGQPTEGWRTVIGKIDALDQMGRYSDALQIARKAYRYFQKHGLQLWAAKVEANTGNIYQHLDRYPEALKAYSSAYAVLAREQPVDGHVLLFNQATTHLCAGNPDKAIPLLETTRRFFEAQGLTSFLARTHYHLAYSHYLSGKYQDALQHLQEARLRMRKLRDHSFLASCYLDEAELYLRLNQTREALQKARLALKKFAALRMPYEKAESSALIAMAMLRLERVSEAIPHLTSARSFFQKQNNGIKCAELNSHLALAYLKKNELNNALKSLSSAQSVFRKHKLFTRLLSTSTYIAGIQLRKGQAAAAQATLNSMDRIRPEVTLPWVLLSYYQMRGRIELELGHRHAADSLETAIGLIESMRTEIPAEDLRISFFQDKLAPYHLLIEHGLKQGNAAGAATAFLYSERARSRALLDLVEGSLQYDPEDSRATRLFQRLDALRNESWRRSVTGSASLQTTAKEREMERRILRLMRQSQRAGKKHDRSTFSIARLRRHLSPGQAIVSFFVIDDSVHAFVIDGEGLVAFPYLARLQDLLLPWQFLHFQMERVRLDPQSNAAIADAHLQTLYDRLIAPMHSRLRKSRMWTVIPHGPLHAFPFHLLRDHAGYLCQDYEFSYAPSCAIYLHCLEMKSRKKNVVLFGVPDELSPLVDLEISEILGIVPRATQITGAAAQASRLIQEAQESRILHIAGHGRFLRNQPFSSGLLFSDGWFTLPAIYQLKMNADLVVLSGCETGGNEIAAGDELLGLLRGFLYAGAASVMVSLWRVSDASTAFFMREFYSALQEGRHKPEAWQIAAMRTRTVYPHPYYWGPFLLVGKT